MKALPLLLLSACATSRAFSGAGDNADLVRSTVASVNAAAGCSWLEVADNTLVVSSNAELRADELNALGYFDALNNVIVLTEPNGYNSASRAQVLVHEIGHAVGLDHGSGVMRPVFTPMTWADAVRSLVTLARAGGLLVCGLSAGRLFEQLGSYRGVLGLEQLTQSDRPLRVAR